MLDLLDSHITGTQVAYYIICKRKLWLFVHNMEMEKHSDLVYIGKLISEHSFKREKFKEVEIGDTIKIDFIKFNDEIIVHEVKKSRKMEEAHIWQVKFYIYELLKKGVECKRGVIHYPKLMKKIYVEFGEEDKSKIEEALGEIQEIKNMRFPPSVINKPYCKKCAYYLFCYV